MLVYRHSIEKLVVDCLTNYTRADEYNIFVMQEIWLMCSDFRRKVGIQWKGALHLARPRGSTLWAWSIHVVLGVQHDASVSPLCCIYRLGLHMWQRGLAYFPLLFFCTYFFCFLSLYVHPYMQCTFCNEGEQYMIGPISLHCSLHMFFQWVWILLDIKIHVYQEYIWKPSLQCKSLIRLSISVKYFMFFVHTLDIYWFSLFS